MKRLYFFVLALILTVVIVPSCSKKTVTEIVFENGNATVNGDGAIFDGSTLTVSKNGNYIFSGSLDGSIVIDANGEVKLDFSGVTVNSDNSAITVLNAEKVVISTTADSENVISNESDALIVSNAVVEFAGEGSLGLYSSDKPVIKSTKNILMTSGEIDMATEGDAMVTDGDIILSGGEFIVENAYRGLIAKNIGFEGASVVLNTGDTSAIANENLSISDGFLMIYSGGNGICATNDISVSGGETYISGSENGLSQALLYGGEGMITGGIFFATSTSANEMNFGEKSTQGSAQVFLDTVSSFDVGVKDTDSNILYSYTPQHIFNSAIISCPEFEIGKTYTIMVGDIEGDITFEQYIYSGGRIGEASSIIDGIENGAMIVKSAGDYEIKEDDEPEEEKPSEPEVDIGNEYYSGTGDENDMSRPRLYQ